MQLLSRDDILNNSDLKVESVPVPEWGQDAGVFVRSLGAIERDQWDKREYQDRKPEMVGYKSRFCALTICNEGGTRIFTETDAPALAGKSAAAIERIFNAAAKLNGLLAADSAVIEKNSEAALSGESSGL